MPNLFGFWPTALEEWKELHDLSGQEYALYRNTTGFRHETLTDDPAVRKAVDDILWDYVGEENPQRSGGEMKLGGLCR